MKKRILGLVLCILIGLGSLGYILRDMWLTKENKEMTKKVAAMFDIDAADEVLAEQIHKIEKEESATKKDKKDTSKRIEKKSVFEELRELNSEVVAVIYIPDTDIMYPVLQRDNEYYLTHNIYGEEDRYGSIFMDESCDNSMSSNYILFGHAMKDATMFGKLKQFQNETYFKEHQKVYLYTEYERAEYTLTNVVLSKGEEEFEKMYEVFPLQQESDGKRDNYAEFIKSVEENTLFSGEEHIQNEDGLLMLITCSYHEKDGRLALVGRKNIENR